MPGAHAPRAALVPAGVMSALVDTARLSARHFTPADAPALHDICADPRVMRHVGEGEVLGLERCREWIGESIGHYARRGQGACALFVKGESLLAGYCGIVPAVRRRDLEIIYALRPGWWGQGLGTELVTGLLDLGLRELALPRLVATIAPRNLPSRRAAERAGMHCAGEETDPDGREFLIYLRESR